MREFENAVRVDGNGMVIGKVGEEVGDGGREEARGDARTTEVGTTNATKGTNGSGEQGLGSETREDARTTLEGSKAEDSEALTTNGAKDTNGSGEQGLGAETRGDARTTLGGSQEQEAGSKSDGASLPRRSGKRRQA